MPRFVRFLPGKSCSSAEILWKHQFVHVECNPNLPQRGRQSVGHIQRWQLCCIQRGWSSCLVKTQAEKEAKGMNRCCAGEKPKEQLHSTSQATGVEQPGFTWTVPTKQLKLRICGNWLCCTRKDVWVWHRQQACCLPLPHTPAGCPGQQPHMLDQSLTEASHTSPIVLAGPQLWGGGKYGHS